MSTKKKRMMPEIIRLKAEFKKGRRVPMKTLAETALIGRRTLYAVFNGECNPRIDTVGKIRAAMAELKRESV